MAQLSVEARGVLKAARVSVGAYAAAQGYSGEIRPDNWPGDSCGCPDDRCIGYHHFADEECGCLRTLVTHLVNDRRKNK